MSSLPDKGATVPVVNLGPPEISAEHLFEAWYQAVSPLFDVVPIQDPRSYYCSATSYLVDQLMFNHTAFAKTSGQRVRLHYPAILRHGVYAGQPGEWDAFSHGA